MARITLSGSTPGGKLFRAAVASITSAQGQLERAKLIADQVSGGGVTKANLEQPGDFEAATGHGADLYDDIVSLKTTLDGLLTTIAKYDQGQ